MSNRRIQLTVVKRPGGVALWVRALLQMDRFGRLRHAVNAVTDDQPIELDMLRPCSGRPIITRPDAVRSLLLIQFP